MRSELLYGSLPSPVSGTVTQEISPFWSDAKSWLLWLLLGGRVATCFGDCKGVNWACAGQPLLGSLLPLAHPPAEGCILVPPATWFASRAALHAVGQAHGQTWCLGGQLSDSGSAGFWPRLHPVQLYQNQSWFTCWLCLILSWFQAWVGKERKGVKRGKKLLFC